MRFVKRLGILAGTYVLAFAVFRVAVHPWMLSWGATAEEQLRELPGDTIVPHAGTQNTRAITIHAQADRVWPWLAQLGQDRGGFYSYERLENLVGCEMPRSGVVQAELGNWQIGDKLWMYPPRKAGGAGFATLRVLEPGYALGFGTRMVGTNLAEPEDGSWTFVLEPVDGETTRLLIRGRGTDERSILGTLFDRVVFEPVHFVMERRMMVGLAAAAEGRTMSRFDDDVQIALWVIAGLLLGVANVIMLSAKSWRRPWLGLVAGLAVFQVLTFVQPSIVVGAALVSCVAAILFWLRQSRQERFAEALAAARIAAPAGR